LRSLSVMWRRLAGGRALDESVRHCSQRPRHCVGPCMLPVTVDSCLSFAEFQGMVSCLFRGLFFRACFQTAVRKCAVCSPVLLACGMCLTPRVSLPVAAACSHLGHLLLSPASLAVLSCFFLSCRESACDLQFLARSACGPVVSCVRGTGAWYRAPFARGILHARRSPGNGMSSDGVACVLLRGEAAAQPQWACHVSVRVALCRRGVVRLLDGLVHRVCIGLESVLVSASCFSCDRGANGNVTVCGADFPRARGWPVPQLSGL
jgi:hypothetical protein